MARGLIKQKERVAEAEQHHRQALATWQEEEARVKSEITALTSAKTRHQANSKELEGRRVKQKEILHDQVGFSEILKLKHIYITIMYAPGTFIASLYSYVLRCFIMIILQQEAEIQQLRRHIHDLTHDSNNNTAAEADQQKYLEVLQQRLHDTSNTIKVLTRQLVSLKVS